MPSPTLTVAELRQITDACHVRKQIEWLSAWGFHFVLSSKGRPKVDREHYLAVMSRRTATVVPTGKTEPNLNALQELQK